MFFFQSNVENLSPQIIRQVCKELSDLAGDPPEGIKVYPNEEDVTEIHATIEGPCKTPLHHTCTSVKFFEKYLKSLCGPLDSLLQYTLCVLCLRTQSFVVSCKSFINHILKLIYEMSIWQES